MNEEERSPLPWQRPLAAPSPTLASTVHPSPIHFRDRHPALDGLRALAVITVMLFHFVPGLLPYRIMELGWAGVDLFFVLSGFLITGILLDTRGHKYHYRTFIIRRALRILPLSYGVLAIVFLTATLTDHPDLRITAGHQFWFWTYTQNLWFAFEGWPKDLGLLNHFWSLAVEEQFYLLWPLVVAGISPKRLHFVLLPALALGPVLRYLFPEMPFAFTFTLSRLDGLLTGALLAWAMRFRPGVVQRWWRTVGLFAILSTTVLLALLVRSGHTEHPAITQWGPFVLALLSGALLIQAFHRTGAFGRLFQAVFTWAPLRMIGRISYGVYVLHWPILLLLPTAVAYAALNGFPEEAVHKAVLLLYIPTVLVLSLLSHRFWERPFLRLKDRLAPYRKDQAGT